MADVLRPYQASAIEGVVNHWRRGVRRVLLAAPTGAGKSLLASEFCNLELSGGGSVLFVVHRRELLKQGADRFTGRFGKPEVGIVAPGANLQPYARIQVGTVQTLLARNVRPDSSLVIFDECFPAGTLVDGRPIETVSVGDTVDAFNHETQQIEPAAVTRVFKTLPAGGMVHVRIGSRSITCTEGHPFFTKRGYVAAKELRTDDMCYLRRALSTRQEEQGPEELLDGMQNRANETSASQEGNHSLSCVRGRILPAGIRNAASEGLCVLLGAMREHPAQQNDGGDESAPCERAYEAQKSNARSCHSRARIGHSEDDWASSSVDRWQRARFNRAAKDAPGRTELHRLWVGGGSSDPDQGGQWFATQCVSGYREPAHQSERRDRRLFSRNNQGEGFRQEEDCFFDWKRVDRVEILEQASSGQHERLCPDGFVYNLEVEHHHNYFAEGILVHNCHHYAAADWSDLAKHYDNARLLGLTATPERQDGKPLGDLFDELVVAAKYSELIRDNFLVQCCIYKPPAMDAGDLAQDPLIAYQRYADNSQTFVFCASVEAAELLATRFNDAGIPAKCIEANTPKGERDATIAAFTRGELKVITNVNTMTEGVDIPAARCVILARSFRHVGGYLQACGRVLRPYPGKLHAIIIDLVGCTLVHNFPTADREYSLEGEGIKLGNGVQPVSQCASCGISYPSRPGGCPECGYITPQQEKALPKIWDHELEAVFAGTETPESAKLREYQRLRELGRKRGWKLYMVQKEYAKLFGETPVIHDASEDEMKAEFARLSAIQKQKNFKPGYVGVLFQKMFGRYPRKDWAA